MSESSLDERELFNAARAEKEARRRELYAALTGAVDEDERVDDPDPALDRLADLVADRVADRLLARLSGPQP